MGEAKEETAFNPLPVVFEAIPDLLKGLDHWVVWQAKPKAGGKAAKVPVSPETGQAINAQDPKEHLTFANAKLAYERGQCSGVGIVLTGAPVEQSPEGKPLYLVGIDMDNVEPSTAREEVAKNVWRELEKCYLEVSPSATGCRMFALSRYKPHSGQSAEGELYAEKRFLTVTGHSARETVKEATDGIISLQARWFPTKMSGNVVQLTQALGQADTDRLAGNYWPETEDRISHVRTNLAHIPPDIAYDTWRNCVWAVASLDWKCGPDLVGDWSRGSAAHWQSDGGEQAQAAIASLFADYDPSRQISIGTLLHVASEHGAPKPDHSPRSVVQSSSVFTQRFNLLSRADLDALPPLRWIVPDVLPDTGLAAIYGAPGSGKSFLAIDLAAHISNGTGSWFRREVGQRDVVYIALEGGRGIRQRLAAWDKHNGLEAKNMKVILEPLLLLDAGCITELIGTLSACKPGAVVIIDTLSQATLGADENSGLDMGKALSAVQQIASAITGLVILVHHSGKDAARGLRGHSSLNAAMDAVIVVERNLQNGYRNWRVAKMKDGDDNAVGSFNLDLVSLGTDHVGIPLTSCAVMEVALMAETKPHTPPGKHAKAIYTGLMALPDNDDGWSYTIVDLVAKEALSDVTSQHRSSRAKAAINALVSGGFIIKTDRGFAPP